MHHTPATLDYTRAITGRCPDTYTQRMTKKLLIVLAAVLLLGIGMYVYASKEDNLTTDQVSGPSNQHPGVTVTESALVGVWGRDANKNCTATDPADPCIEAAAYMDIGSPASGYAFDAWVGGHMDSASCRWSLDSAYQMVSVDCPEPDADVTFRIISLTNDALTLTYGDTAEAVTYFKDFKE